MSEAVRRVVARRDPALRARVVRTVPLTYAEGADAALDRPAHVRAGSGLAWTGGALAVMQDDANFVALADPATGLCRAIPLPAGEGGLRQFDDVRGNKRFKLDLEACATVPDACGDEMVVAFGSGSSALRERVLHVRDAAGPAPRVELREALTFYARLRDAAEFAGSELNVEGAVWRAGRLVLLNRGNGAAVDGRQPVDATCEVEWAALRAYLDGPGAHPAPGPENVIQYALGEIDGCRLTFTDAAAFGGALVYTATAEASPNAVDDGPVAGSAVGIIGADGEARWTVLENAAGAGFDAKVEGLARGPRPGTLYVVVDRDDPHLASQLCEVELAGDWPV
ncbi:MAG TPA: hypothetical protein VGC13_13815 [Longimicrobium sp.]|jgi:hypothetical protein|uniref:DUF6929 family protein n=1 Tax=Longimicrobium sp. TaxID=2029185 RepID=UPI002EDA9F11